MLQSAALDTLAAGRPRALLPRARSRCGRTTSPPPKPRSPRSRPARPAPSPARRCCGWPRPTSSRAATTPRLRPTPRALAGQPADPDRLTHKLAVSLERAGDVAGSIAAHRRVYFDFPLSPDADASGDALERLGALDADFEGRLARERARADALFAARRWALARTGLRPGRRSLGWRCACRGGGARRWQRRLPEAVPQCRRSAAPAGRRGPAPGRGPALPGAGRPWAGPDGRLRAGRARAGGAVPDQSLHRGGTQRPGDLAWWSATTTPARPRSSARWCGCSPPGGSPSGRRGRPDGGPTASARWPTPCSSSRSAPPSFPRSDYRPSWLYWSARAKEQLGDASGACGPLHPRGHRLPEQLLRPAGAAPDGQAVGAALDSREPGAAADAAADAGPDRLAAVARPQRPGAGRDPVRPPRPGAIRRPWSRPPRWRSTAPAACASASTP